MTPKVSVVMPVFRHTGEQLLVAVESILNQTFTDWELIIADGNPKNQNFKLISSIKDKRIRYCKAKGYINCLNLGLELARGIYVARMDSDDVAFPQRLQEQVRFLDDNTDVALCSCLVEYFGAKEGFSSHKGEITFINFLKKTQFIHAAMMFRKSLNIRYDEFKPLEDCLLFRKLLLKGCKFAILDRVLLKNYIAENSIMAKHSKYCDFLLSKINIYALAAYYHFNLSFADEILTSKRFSREEVLEYLRFVRFLKPKLKANNLNAKEICLPFFAYMLSRQKNKWFLVKSKEFYLSVFGLYWRIFTQKCLKFVFSVTNDYSKYGKMKKVCVLGLKYRFKAQSKSAH